MFVGTWAFYPLAYAAFTDSLPGAVPGVMQGASPGVAEVVLQVGYSLADITAKAGYGLLIHAIVVRKTQAMPRHEREEPPRRRDGLVPGGRGGARCRAARAPRSGGAPHLPPHRVRRMPPTAIARAAWPALTKRLHALAPEAFNPDGHVLNLVDGAWGHPGRGKPFLSSVDGTALGSYPMLDLPSAAHAVRFAADEGKAWAKVPLGERQKRVAECVGELRKERDLLALLLVWEIGKPYQLALVDVDRCLEGVEWYVGQMPELMHGRTPLGLVSNIASWNYPMSVLMHSVLVQVLCGNATISKTPSDGGLFCLTAACAVARRCGLPVSLVSGSGGPTLRGAGARTTMIDCLAFVGGKSNGREIAAKPHQPHQAVHARDGGRERLRRVELLGLARPRRPDEEGLRLRQAALHRVCEVGRPALLAAASSSKRTWAVLKFNPRRAPAPGRDAPAASRRCWRSARSSTRRRPNCSRDLVGEAVGLGGLPVYQGQLDPARFLPDQDTSAYFAPAALLNVPRNSRLYHEEPFGPVDTIVVVDRLDELVAEMNVSNGSLVASIACDDAATSARVAGELRAFKVGVNKMRSRGDREEVFGGIGQSWKGHFVGGKYLVNAVTLRPGGGAGLRQLPGLYIGAGGAVGGGGQSEPATIEEAVALLAGRPGDAELHCHLGGLYPARRVLRVVESVPAGATARPH